MAFSCTWEYGLIPPCARHASGHQIWLAAPGAPSKRNTDNGGGGGVCKANQRGWRTTQDSIREQKSGQGVAGSRVGQERSQRSLNISTPSTLEVEGPQGSGATRQWGLREAVFRFHHPPNWKRFQRPSTWGRMNKALQPHHEKLLRDRKEQATDERQQHG